MFAASAPPLRDLEYPTCYPCGHQPRHLPGVLPISYSVHFGQLHHALRQYKDGPPPVSRRFELELAAVTWRFLEDHEACLARRVRSNFELVTTVPSGERERDSAHPLPRIAASIGPTRDRFERILRRSEKEVLDRTFNPEKFVTTRALDGEPVLLLDDTWTTGASAQSAAAALIAGGASTVALAVIGRHVHEDFRANRERLDQLPRRFDWDVCAFE